MSPEPSPPVLLQLHTSGGQVRSYPWWGLVTGLLVGVFVGHPVSMVVQNVQDYFGKLAPLNPLAALYHSFHFSYMWPMMLLYALVGGVFGVILGYVLQRLQEQRLLMQLLHHEFELQVATLRHHYKNLAIGIRGFSGRIKRNVATLEAQCRDRQDSRCQEFRQDVEALERNVSILDDTAKRLTSTLGQELLFLKALTSETLRPESRDLYPLLVASVRDLVDLRFRDKPLTVTINGQSWNRSRDSLVFSFEPNIMEIVLQNLLSNAMKFGDRVAIEVKERRSWVQVAIADNGPGLKVEKLKQRLQAPAERREVDSTHLGLMVSMNLLEKNGGRLLVQSEPGAGATFFLEIPKRPPAA